MFSCRCFCFVLLFVSLSIVNCDSLEIEICPEPPFFFLSSACDSLVEDLITETHLYGGSLWGERMHFREFPSVTEIFSWFSSWSCWNPSKFQLLLLLLWVTGNSLPSPWMGPNWRVLLANSRVDLKCLAFFGDQRRRRRLTERRGEEVFYGDL